MSTIRAVSNENIWKIDKFLGLNENPDGDTKLKLGEASVCLNWKVTRDRNLKRRPGLKTVASMPSTEPIRGLWFGNVNGDEIGLAACDYKLLKFYENGFYLQTPQNLGALHEGNVSFFPFSNIVYILDGTEYYQYDGTTFKTVEGYVPTVATSRDPTGADSSLLQGVNKLTAKRNVLFSPDGTSTTYVLPESGLGSVNSVKDLSSGTEYTVDGSNAIVNFERGAISSAAGEDSQNTSTTRIRTDFLGSYITGVTPQTGYRFVLFGYDENKDYIGCYDGGDFTNSATWFTTHVSLVGLPSGARYFRIVFANVTNTTPIDVSEAVNCTFSGPTSYVIANLTDGTVIFPSAPVRGINTVEMEYAAKNDFRTDVTSMTNAELYLGAQDTAVFLYGNGTNQTIYSGVDYNGEPRADYFPDLNVISVADDNTPITGLIRHSSRLMCYKSTSTYSISYGTIGTALGDTIWGFYVTPVNKIIGNVALGQVRLVLNSPVTLFGNDLYKWENTSPYSAEITRDERMAIRISDKIYASLGKFRTVDCYCYDDNYGQEYYIWDGGDALVWNYAADAWYYYTIAKHEGVACMCNIHNELLCGMNDGNICLLSEGHYTDDGEAFRSYWESGSIDFGKPFQRKFTSEVWAGIKPQEHSKVTITVMTDKKSDYSERIINCNLSTFSNVNFGDFSFLTNRKPQVKKLKIKAKKFAYLKFVLKSNEPDSTATVLMIDPKVRETGYVK